MNFIHVNPLPDMKYDETTNEYLGRKLGFFFPGDIDHKSNMYSSVHYKGNESHFYAEVCKTIINDDSSIKKREREWNEITRHINVVITSYTEVSMTSEYLLSIIINKDIDTILKYSDVFLSYFEKMDYTLPSFASLLKKDLKTNFFKYYDYILMITLCKEECLFELDLKMSDEFEKLVDDYIVNFIIENDNTSKRETHATPATRAITLIDELVNKCFLVWLDKIGSDILTTITQDEFLKRKQSEMNQIICKFNKNYGWKS